MTLRRGDDLTTRNMTSVLWLESITIPYGPDDVGEDAGWVAGGGDRVEEPDAVRDHAPARWLVAVG